MAVTMEAEPEMIFADKHVLLRILEEQDRVTGFVPVPNATARQARKMMLADGVRPEDNLFSRGIIEMREE